MARTIRKWTRQEDARLIRQVKAFPQNISKCCMLVAEEIDRTPAAVSFHWYSKLSKEPDVLAFFMASSQRISKNRKNGMGEESSPSIWRRLMAIIRNL